MGAVTRSTIQWAHVLMRGDTVIGNGTVTAVCVKKNPDGTMKSARDPRQRSFASDSCDVGSGV